MKARNDGKNEEVSQASLAARKAWLTRKQKQGIDEKESKKKSEGKEVQVEQSKAGGVKKPRIGKRLTNGLMRVLRDSKKSIVLDRHEEYRQFLWGKNYREDIMKNKECEKCKESRWGVRVGIVNGEYSVGL
jgi:hypothetical protein